MDKCIYKSRVSIIKQIKRVLVLSREDTDRVLQLKFVASDADQDDGRHLNQPHALLASL